MIDMSRHPENCWQNIRKEGTIVLGDLVRCNQYHGPEVSGAVLHDGTNFCWGRLEKNDSGLSFARVWELVHDKPWPGWPNPYGTWR